MKHAIAKKRAAKQVSAGRALSLVRPPSIVVPKGAMGAPVLEWHPARDLRAGPDHAAQRPIVLKKAMEIAVHLDPVAIEQAAAVRCTLRGVYGLWLVNARNRCAGIVGHDLLKLGMDPKNVAAMLAEHDSDLTHVYPLGVGSALVLVGIDTSVTTDKEASARFLRLNSAASVSTLAKYENGVVAGYPRESGIEAVLHANGLVMASGASANLISCPGALYKAYDLDGTGDCLGRALPAIITAWGRTASAYEGAIIEGVSRFCFEEGADSTQAVRVLRKWNCTTIYQAARALYDGKAASSIAAGIVIKLQRKHR